MLPGYLLTGTHNFEALCTACAYEVDGDQNASRHIILSTYFVNTQSLMLQHFKRSAFKRPQFPN